MLVRALKTELRNYGTPVFDAEENREDAEDAEDRVKRGTTKAHMKE